MSNLLIEIARCEECDSAKINTEHPCHKIINTQDGYTFQLPEPWNGDISNAVILFISSNPSINQVDERYPDETWSDNEVKHFFSNRFSEPYYQRRVPFWTKIKKYASWILDIPQDDKSLPNKICITEVVHCKSKQECGVREACTLCAEKWFSKVLNEFHGKYVVLLGVFAQKVGGLYIPDGITPLRMPHTNAHGITDEQRKSIIRVWKAELEKK